MSVEPIPGTRSPTPVVDWWKIQQKLTERMVEGNEPASNRQPLAMKVLMD